MRHVHALLHQASRVRDGAGRVVATLADYAVVRELVADLVAEGVESAVPPTVRETVEAARTLISAGKAVLSVADVAKDLGLDKSAASRRVRAAQGLGYLLNEETRKGRAACLTLGSLMPDEVEILPPVEALAVKTPRPHEEADPDPPDRCTVAGDPEGVSPVPGTSGPDAGTTSEPGMNDLYSLFDGEGGEE